MGKDPVATMKLRAIIATGFEDATRDSTGTGRSIRRARDAPLATTNPPVCLRPPPDWLVSTRAAAPKPRSTPWTGGRSCRAELVHNPRQDVRRRILWDDFRRQLVSSFYNEIRSAQKVGDQISDLAVFYLVHKSIPLATLCRLRCLYDSRECYRSTNYRL
jgi:hypothetical protein